MKFNCLFLFLILLSISSACKNTSYNTVYDDSDDAVVLNDMDELTDPEGANFMSEAEETDENDEAAEDDFFAELDNEGADDDVPEDSDNTDADVDEVENRVGSISFNYNKSDSVIDFSLGGELSGYGINEFLEVTRKISITEYVVEASLRGGFIQHGHQVKAHLSVPFDADFPYEVNIDDESSYVRLYAEGLGFIHERLGAKGTVTVYSLKSPLTEVLELNFEGIDLEIFDKQ